MLVGMQDASDAFYYHAVKIGCHPFIEFTGLLNEYINICRAAHAAGIDFTETSVHGSGVLPVKPHHVAYLSEKLACIYGNSVCDILLARFTKGPEEPCHK